MWAPSRTMSPEPAPGTWLTRAAATHGKHPALVTDACITDFAGLHARCGELAAALTSHGWRQGEPWAIASHHPSHVAWATYVSLYCGSALLPLDPRRPGTDGLLAECGIGQLCTDGDAPVPGDIRRLPTSCLEVPGTKPGLASRIAPASAVQLFMSTSGTEGRPQGVMLTGANLAAAVRAARRRTGLGPGDVWLSCLPLFHIGGLSILLRCLEADATALLHEDFEPEKVLRDLGRRRVTHLSLVPAMLARLLEQGGDRPPPNQLRTVLVGGGPLTAPLMERARQAGWPVCPTYGLTENGSQVATLSPPAREWQAGDMGRPLPGLRVQIVDARGKPTGGRGRIRLYGPTVMAGYANPAHAPGQGLARGGLTTSDLGYLDERAHLHVLGRADDMLISGGENVHPAEVEARLSRCPGITDVGVSGRADPVWGECLVAVVVGRLDSGTLEGWCRDHMPGPLRPREFVRVEQLPRNGLGKLDRRGLRDWLGTRGIGYTPSD